LIDDADDIKSVVVEAHRRFWRAKNIVLLSGFSEGKIESETYLTWLVVQRLGLDSQVLGSCFHSLASSSFLIKAFWQWEM
jgi:hypothetical protein